MIELQPHASGTILPIRARPGARRNEICGEQDGTLRVCVTQPPEKGITFPVIKSLSLDA